MAQGVCRSTEPPLAARPGLRLRGDLQCGAPARAISLAGAAWPLCPWGRHCCGSGAFRRDGADRLAPERDPLPAALIAVSLFRLISWFQARANVELEALELVRRKVRAASVLGPTLTFAFALTTAISTWQDGVVEFALALLAVWVVAAVCAICLNRIASEASIIVVAATAPLIVAFLARGAELTLVLAALFAIAACFVIRMLDESFRMFAEIVRSRFVIAESSAPPRRRGRRR